MQSLLDTHAYLFSAFDAGKWLAARSDVFLAGVSSAIIALSGVILTTYLNNSSNLKRLKTQLEHEATENVQNRISTIRKDVFLPVAEEMTNAITFLSSMPQMDFASSGPIDGTRGLLIAISRLQLVSSIETSIAASKVSEAYGKLIIPLMSQFPKLRELKTKIDFYEGLANGFQKNIERIVDERNRMIETGIKDDDLFNNLGSAASMHQKSVERYTSDRNEFSNVYNRELKKFSLTLFNEVGKVAKVQSDLLALLRSDLGFESDADRFYEQLEKNRRSMAESLEALKKSINEDQGN